MTILPAKSAKFAGPSFHTFRNGISGGNAPFCNCAGNTLPSSAAAANKSVTRWTMARHHSRGAQAKCP